MSSYHGERVLSQYNTLLGVLDQNHRVRLQGDSLDFASLVAVAKYDPSMTRSGSWSSVC
jgi:hypothetical protein